MQQERFYTLLSRKFANEATSTELAELEQLMRQYPEWRDLAAQYPQHRASSTESDYLDANAAYAAHAVKMQLSGRNSEVATPPPSAYPEKTGRRVKTGAVLAASLVLLAVGVVYLGKKAKKPLPGSIPPGKSTHAITRLPDGTMVWLGANSNLVYPDTINGSKLREVTLIGQARFELYVDSLQPFLIHTGNIDVLASGKSLTIKNYPHEETLEIANINGKVTVIKNDAAEGHILLKSGEKLTLQK